MLLEVLFFCLLNQIVSPAQHPGGNPEGAGPVAESITTTFLTCITYKLHYLCHMETGNYNDISHVTFIK